MNRSGPWAEKEAKLFRSIVFCVCGVLAFGTAGSAAPGDAGSAEAKRAGAPAPKPTVSAEQIREALRSPDERSFKTMLGTLTLRRSNDDTDTPGKLFLNGELIYAARQQEALPHFRGRPFGLRVIDWQWKGEHIWRMVVEERSWTCQYLVLDFTGPKVWISKRFPEGFQGGECMDMTWVRWEKELAYFYFGADQQDWEKGKYRGWVEGYNPKLKNVFGPVDAPPPPRNASLVPKLKPH